MQDLVQDLVQDVVESHRTLRIVASSGLDPNLDRSGVLQPFQLPHVSRRYLNRGPCLRPGTLVRPFRVQHLLAH